MVHRTIASVNCALKSNPFQAQFKFDYKSVPDDAPSDVVSAFFFIYFAIAILNPYI
ncbi:hypothetical protein NXX42_00195 [Bacteroides thetaiotaomicron]|nr:hypothetical protein [Bacteroides thetaiotaomicron]